MKELIEKMKKYSAKQLVEKLEKGKVDEDEKNIIIAELRRKGRDVTPYTGDVTTEDGELINQPGDAENLTEGKISVSERLKKEKDQKKEAAIADSGSAPEKRVRINFQSEQFPKGSTVQINGATTLVEDQAKGVVKSSFHWEGKPENWYVVIAPLSGGKNFSKSFKGVTLVSLPSETETSEEPATEEVVEDQA